MAIKFHLSDGSDTDVGVGTGSLVPPPHQSMITLGGPNSTTRIASSPHRKLCGVHGCPVDILGTDRVAAALRNPGFDALRTAESSYVPVS
jgi:hypothetical protein